MMNLTMTSPVIRHIRFDPIPHTYTDEDMNVYTSVTTKVDQYKLPFNRKYWAAYKAAERGITTDEILAEWDAITETANKKGNYVHEGIETSLNTASIGRLGVARGSVSTNPVWGYEMSLEVLANTKTARKYPLIYQCIAHYVSKGFTIYAEKRVYLYEYLLAGTIDLLLVKDDKFIIVDWKTNKDELKFESGYYKKWKGIKTDIWVPTQDRMLAPLGHIAHCKGSGYTMQLSTYAYMCECWGYTCLGLILFHIQEMSIETAANDDIQVTPKCYNIPYWKKEVELMLNHKPVIHNDRVFRRSTLPRINPHPQN